MTELFIDNEQVRLPNDFNTEVIEGNPFINPIGETSLDITLSLLEPSNAYIFGYLQRPASTEDIRRSRDCRLSVDAIEHHGKCIVLEFSDEEVKIQLVFRNSIFTHAIDEDLKLKNLDLGTATIDKSNIVANLDKTYPEVDFQLLMIYNPDITYDMVIGHPIVDGDLINRYSYSFDNTHNIYRLVYAHDGFDVQIKDMFGNGDIRIKKEMYSPQPYLSAIIRKVITALGFEMSVNEISENPIFKNAIIVNGATSRRFVDMLPDWTVKKFIEQIQIWQNCRFIYDPLTRVVNIRYNHINSINPTYTQLEVLDDFGGTSKDDDPIMNRQRNIEYNLPDTEGYRYTRIDQKILDEFVNVTMSTNILQDAITALITNGNPAWIYHHKNVVLIMQDGIPKIVHEYPTLRNNSDKDSVDETLDIIPAEMKLIKFYVRDRMSTSTSSWKYIMVPVNRESAILLADVDDVEQSIPVDDAVQDPASIQGDQQTSSLMQIVLYNPTYKNPNVSGTFVYADPFPEPYTRSVSDINPEGEIRTLVDTIPQVEYFLSLDFLNRFLYTREFDVDPTKLYRFRFQRPMEKLDITNVFVINNEFYRAFQFHKTITSDGMDEVIEGEFYKIK